jgi:hypothetical protein
MHSPGPGTAPPPAAERPAWATRADAATGLAALLFLVGFVVQGDPPSPDEPTRTISGYLADHRDAILAGDLILAGAAAPFLWFLGALRGYLAEGGEWSLSGASVLGMGVGTGLVLAAAALQAGLVLNTATASEALVRYGFDSFNALITIAGGFFAVGAGAAAISGRRSGRLPGWLWGSGVVTGLLQLVTLPGLVLEHGPWAAGGPIPLFAFVVLVAWFVALTARMLRTERGDLPGHGSSASTR